MEKEKFCVVGKQVIHSNQKNADYCMVHIMVPFNDQEITSGAQGARVFSTMVTPSEYNRIGLNNYTGYIMQNGRYTSVAFDEQI